MNHSARTVWSVLRPRNEPRPTMDDLDGDLYAAVFSRTEQTSDPLAVRPQQHQLGQARSGI